MPGEPRQVLTDLDAGHRRGDLAEGTTVGMTGLEVEGVHLRRTAVHPEEDARASAFRVSRGIGRQGPQPAGHRVAGEAGGGQSQPIATGQLQRRTRHEGILLV